MTAKRFWALSMLAHVGLLAAFSVFALDQFSRLAETEPVLTVTDVWQIQTDFFPPPPPVPERKETPPELLNSDVHTGNEDFQAPKETVAEDTSKTEPGELADDPPPARELQPAEFIPEKAHADIGHVSDPEWAHFRPRNTRPSPATPGPAAVIASLGSAAGSSTESGVNAPVSKAGSGTSVGVAAPAAGSGEGTGGVRRGASPINMDGGAYPRQAQKEAREGIVQLRVEVLETGRVGHIELYRSSGHTDLDETALGAARRWRFRPATRDGMAVATWVVVPVRYQLSEAR